MMGVDHYKIILLSTPFLTIQCWVKLAFLHLLLSVLCPSYYYYYYSTGLVL